LVIIAKENIFLFKIQLNFNISCVAGIVLKNSKLLAEELTIKKKEIVDILVKAAMN
jgi:hypothetical protein